MMWLMLFAVIWVSLGWLAAAMWNTYCVKRWPLLYDESPAGLAYRRKQNWENLFDLLGGPMALIATYLVHGWYKPTWWL